jgi:hypothetical protein
MRPHKTKKQKETKNQSPNEQSFGSTAVERYRPKKKKRKKERKKRRPYRAILLLVRSTHALSWKLPAFAHGDKGGAESGGDYGTDEKATSVKPDDNVDLLVGRDWYGMGYQAMD